MSQRQ
jgi:hypothetical protein